MTSLWLTRQTVASANCINFHYQRCGLSLCKSPIICWSSYCLKCSNEYDEFSDVCSIGKFLLRVVSIMIFLVLCCEACHSFSGQYITRLLLVFIMFAEHSLPRRDSNPGHWAQIRACYLLYNSDCSNYQWVMIWTITV